MWNKFVNWLKRLFGSAEADVLKAEKEMKNMSFYIIRRLGSNVGGHWGATEQEALDDFARAQVYVEGEVKKHYTDFAEYCARTGLSRDHHTMEKVQGT